VKKRRTLTYSLFNILNTPLAIAMQRLSTVTSVVMKIRLRVERTTCGFEIRISPILPASTKWVSSCTVASVGLPETCRAAGTVRKRHQHAALHQAAAVVVLVLGDQRKLEPAIHGPLPERTDQLQEAGCLDDLPATGLELFRSRPDRRLVHSVPAGLMLRQLISSSAGVL
jgi:hypothetical protein